MSDCRNLRYVSATSIKSYGLGANVLKFGSVRFIWQQRPPSLLPSPWETLVPDSATSAMSTPCSCAMKPRTENIAKPDTKLVPLLRPPSSKQSLCHTYVMEVVNEHRRNRGSHFFFFFTQPSLTRVALTSTATNTPSLPVERGLTCSSCICICCSSPAKSWLPGIWRRRRRSGSPRRSTPEDASHVIRRALRLANKL